MENQTEVSLLSCCSSKSKLICVSAGLVALVIVAAASFVLGRASVKSSSLSQTLPSPTITIATPTPDETANWKTYNNKNYGFEISYPASLEAVDQTTELKNFYKEADEKCRQDAGGCGGGPRPSFEIDFVSGYDKERISKENILVPKRPYQFRVLIYEGININILYGGKPPAGATDPILDDKLVGGITGLRKISNVSTSVDYGVDYKGKTYSISFPNKNASDLEYTGKIAGTFKFLD